MEDELSPPWVTFPEIPVGSIGWRMGPGEEVWDIFYRWFSALGDDQVAAYVERHPEPDAWYGTYAMIRDNKWI